MYKSKISVIINIKNKSFGSTNNSVKAVEKMTMDEIRQMISGGEKIDIEFKESSDGLTKDIYDTVCAFNNRIGGHIFLGVRDDGAIVGVNRESVEKIIKEFTTSINNPMKTYPSLYLVPEVYEIDEKVIVYIRVPEGNQVCRHNGKIWDRSYEGDINITNFSEQVYKLYARKHGSYFVNKVYPNFTMDFLDEDTIKRARKMAIARNDQHAWTSMTDEELLRSANLIMTDSETMKEGLTLDDILLFGKENTILSVLPQHKTDALFRVVNLDRYDDREVVTSNLIDSYFELMEFGRKHINDLYTMEGMVNVNARDKILREIISNTLAHRDYSSGVPARLIIEEDKIVVINSNMAHGMGVLDVEKFEPYPKNPTISKYLEKLV